VRKIIFGIATIAFSLASPANAQKLANSVIVNTLLCEAGKVGRELAKKNLPLNARVAVDWKVIDTTTAAGGVGVSIPGLPVGGSGDISQAREKSTKTVGVPFNLHPDNYAVCTGYKVDIVQGGIGLYDCLMGDNFPNLREALKQEEGTVSCGSVVTVTKKASGNLRFTVLGADLGPSGSYESKNVVDTAYAAPTYRKKKE
jgi:hypothetical protein